MSYKMHDLKNALKFCFYSVHRSKLTSITQYSNFPLICFVKQYICMNWNMVDAVLRSVIFLSCLTPVLLIQHMQQQESDCA